MLNQVNLSCSATVGLALVKADLIPQIVTTLNPQSLSFSDAVDIHTNFMNVISYSLWLSTPDGLDKLKIKDGYEQQAVHETIFQQIVAPSAKYICHLCVIRFSIVDGTQSLYLMELLAQLLRICPYNQHTMGLSPDSTHPSIHAVSEGDGWRKERRKEGENALNGEVERKSGGDSSK
ncbi:hypothetical protein BLNAU_10959 [Blattamonas nauphoetae]|uniref:Uncharacterized protein n=1 Tax=Blattamonas nauphoetae TaxID=2049346 RepID=A0ABQ9XNZ8_9EUKA|nr:hypothetical protein BLNAU_10959 [Blattamonas nauphoetae]